MKIQKAVLKDLTECAKLSNIKEFSGTYMLSHSDAKKYFKPFIKNGVFLVAKENSRIVGFICAEYTLSEYVWVDAITVNSAYRKKGIGKSLFTAMEKIAEKKGFKKIFLVVPKFNKKSIEFYKSLKMKKGNECIEFHKK